MLRSTKFFRTCRSLHIGSSRLQIVGNNKGSNFRVKDDPSRVTYALKEDFAELKNKMREEHKGNADTGVKPSDWQKKMLVLTRLYHDRQSIPEYVAASTMRSLSNRIRGYIVLTICLTSSFLLLIGRTEIAQNRPLMDNAISRIESGVGKNHPETVEFQR